MKNKIILLAKLWFILIPLLYIQNAAGQAYFQQQVDTRLDVKLDDVNHILTGTVDIDYTNNSADTLTFIYFHLWPNAYSHDRTAYNQQAVENGNTKFYLADKEHWGFIDSLQFNVDNVKATIEYTTDRDIIKVILPSPLLPKQTVNIFTPFYLQIPNTFSRLGHEGQSYQFTQWFPKPAVYDKHGWHPMPYLDQGEFFSEFGSYEVTITLPENYVVMATGNLETTSEIAWMDSLAAISIPNTTTFPSTPPSSSKMKTIRFTEDNVHDFAWFADKRWVLRKGTYTIPENGHEVEMWSAFFPHHVKGWNESIRYIEEGIAGFSEKVGPYPYETAKAVEGPLIAGGGMEYPTVTIIIPSNDSALVREIIIHEIGHNWFYGILANNERLYPWMDESLNSFLENKIVAHQPQASNFFSKIEKQSYSLFNAHRYSQPVALPAALYRNNNYGIDVYQRGAQNFEWLQAYVGVDTFKQMLQLYYDRHTFQHVYPEDLENVIRSGTTKNVDWFFGPALHSANTIDFSIKNIKNQEHQATITVKNLGRDTLPAIIELTGLRQGDIIRNIVHTPPFIGTHTLTIDKDIDVQYISASIHSSVPDAYMYNNYYRHGKSAPLRFRPFLTFMEAPFYTVNYLPAVAYNVYDGWQLGAALHNFNLPRYRWQYGIAGMYGFGSNKLTGAAWLSYLHHPQSQVIESIEYGVGAKQFGYRSSDLNISEMVVAQYRKIAPEVFITFKRPNPRAPIYRTLSLKGYFIQEDQLQFSMDAMDSLYRPSLSGVQNQVFARVKYNYENYRTFNPYGYALEVQGGGNFIKVGLEGNIKVDYHLANKGLYIRGFIGKFIAVDINEPNIDRFYLTTGYQGVNDYLYDDIYFGRNMRTGFWSRQFQMKEGGFKIATPLYANPLGWSNDWLFALNLKTDLPVKVPIKLYFDIATYSHARTIHPSGTKFIWDAGVELDLNLVKVYIPIIHSKDITDYMKSMYGNKRFWNGISFSIPIHSFRLSQPLESSAIIRKSLMN